MKLFQAMIHKANNYETRGYCLTHCLFIILPISFHFYPVVFLAIRNNTGSKASIRDESFFVLVVIRNNLTNERHASNI
ncbi:MAG: hypothetical protein DRI87_04485 [Bacteroidetes bacterium]|nr:MAG: hypothetical protein DRI87_04485 [Bacteroidota bacterium]